MPPPNLLDLPDELLTQIATQTNDVFAADALRRTSVAAYNAIDMNQTARDVRHRLNGAVIAALQVVLAALLEAASARTMARRRDYITIVHHHVCECVMHWQFGVQPDPVARMLFDLRRALESHPDRPPAWLARITYAVQQLVAAEWVTRERGRLPLCPCIGPSIARLFRRAQRMWLVLFKNRKHPDLLIALNNLLMSAFETPSQMAEAAGRAAGIARHPDVAPDLGYVSAARELEELSDLLRQAAASCPHYR